MTVTIEEAPVAAPATLRERVRRRALVLAFNPLLVRDLRSLLRGGRPLFLQIGYLAVLLTGMAISAFACYSQRKMALSNGYHSDASYGQYMFMAVFEAQVILLALVVVAYSAGSIALEYEKRTYEMLAVTTLSTLEIVLGKVASITALSLMLLVTSLPLSAVCLMLGGVSPGQIASSYLLLAYAIPLWASLGVLLSVLTSRSIGSYVATLLGVALWLGIATGLSDAGGGGTGISFGALSPIAVPIPGVMDHFRLFNRPLPAWITPLVLNGLLTALLMVTAAEAMPLHRAKRSSWLRGLLLTSLFCYLFVAASAILQTMAPAVGTGGGALRFNSPQPMGGPWTPGQATDPNTFVFLRETLFVSLLLAVLSIPAFSTYVAPAEARTRLLGWVLGPVSPRRWLEREANVGWRSTLLLFLVAFSAVVLPVLLAERLHVLPAQTFSPYRLSMLAFALVVYAVALAGYSLWAAGFAAQWQDRRVGALLVVLLMLALNLLGVYYIANPDDFRRLRFLAHPIFALTSPVATVTATLTPGFSSLYWTKEWASVGYVVVLGFLYQAALFSGGMLFLRRLSRRAEVTP